MEQSELKVLLRTVKGKGPARKLRQEGLIPAVLYGPKADPVLLSLRPEELRGALSTAAGENVLISLKAENNREISNKVVMLKDLQVDPLTRRYIHADLYEVVMDEEIEVDVPIHLQGESIGVQEDKGILQQVHRELRVKCLPKDIPEGISIDVSELRIGDSIHVRDVRLEEGVTFVDDQDSTILTVLAPAIEEKPEIVVEEKPEEAEAEEKPAAAEEEKSAKKEE
ncbi:MAG: 50S ribosomal protein L25 [Deltaproteobacteria bacterium]|nr:MAG: 50S ribosomal protein L25 [Deltaproteobacteria bacterium]